MRPLETLQSWCLQRDEGWRHSSQRAPAPMRLQRPFSACQVGACIKSMHGKLRRQRQALLTYPAQADPCHIRAWAHPAICISSPTMTPSMHSRGSSWAPSTDGAEWPPPLTISPAAGPGTDTLIGSMRRSRRRAADSCSLHHVIMTLPTSRAAPDACACGVTEQTQNVLRNYRENRYCEWGLHMKRACMLARYVLTVFGAHGLHTLKGILLEGSAGNTAGKAMADDSQLA